MLTFEQAIEESQEYPKRHVLLGNGFSIACRKDIFVYEKLFEQADFSGLSPSVRQAFTALNTWDFERVIKALRDASSLVSLYKKVQPEVAELMRIDADGLREVLVNTIAASHPEKPSDIKEEEYTSCRKFLNYFSKNSSKIYTLNYDLLLYWTQMHTDNGQAPTSDDGFRKPEDDYEADYVTWEPYQSHSQNMWFLHGALHIFDTGREVQKYTWVNTGVRLIEQIRDALNRDCYPLFVAEGSSDEKLVRIKHSDYLAKAYRSFAEIDHSLFIYGHSLAENDEHYLSLIERGKVRHLFVGIYDDPNTDANLAIMQKANRMSSVRPAWKPLKVSFYDASSAHVWG